MDFFSSIMLGLIQGIAEFLPISSSGHLSLFQELGILRVGDGNDMFFNVLLHLGTLAAVFVAYWGEIKALIMEFLGMVGIRKQQQGSRLNRRMIWFIILGTLPLVVILPIKDFVDSLGENTIFIGCALLATGLILFLSDRLSRGNKDLKSASVWDIVIVGFAQALATVPGLSRSGTTISAGMARGFDREFAVKFSFLMSIPAILGANLLELIDAISEGIDWSLMPVYLVGVLVAAVSGYLSIRLLKFITKKGSFGGFCYYCWGAGLVALVLSLI